MEKYSQLASLSGRNLLLKGFNEEQAQVEVISQNLKDGNLENYVRFYGEEQNKCKFYNLPLTLFGQPLFIGDLKDAFSEYIALEEQTSENSEALTILENKKHAFKKELNRKIEKALTAEDMAKMN